MSFWEELEQWKKGQGRPLYGTPSYEAVIYWLEERGTLEEMKTLIRENFVDQLYIGFGNEGLDLIILEYLWAISQEEKVDNFFIEAGANNGILQSNTCLLEWGLGWRGILIEPNKANALKCQKYRKDSQVWNCALVSDSYEKDYIEGTWDSALAENREMCSGLGSGCTPSHLKDNPEASTKVRARTLTEILEISNAPQNIGFLSLDVEGYELKALQGLDFNKFHPMLILIEIQSKKDEEIYHNFLKSKGYSLVTKPTLHDYLYVRGKIIDSRLEPATRSEEEIKNE